MSSSRSIRCCVHRFSTRSPSTSYISLTRHSIQRRWETTAAAAAAAASTNPKIAQIVDQISQLTLLETADLVSTLKTRLNIPDIPVGGFAAGLAQAGAPAAAAAEEEDAAPAAQEKTLFTLTLKSFDAGSKPKVIKEVKSMLGLSLVDSKKFVESAPKMMKEGVPKDDAQKIIDTMKGLGAVVVME
ncbi:MAG: hypothetical protein GOMPHAMPRED_003482 [Gomphillus americanus]|uniref:Uncharacterized protein n=1 Tax=Gomphillus americanus TaxID=1940652 RepID=A0A8H3IK73_9LECA|nr:MAG: hypothetical protein GOMPHAMPRED_003482 [Gomphillus americanus]